MRDLLNASWKLMVIRGVVAVIFGIVVMVWPSPTVITLTVLWGIWALVDGIGLAVSAFGADEATEVRVFTGVMAGIALISAFFLIIHPTDTVKVLTWVLGAFLIIRGVYDLAVGIFHHSRSASPRWLLFLIGAIDLAIGILFVANPGRAAVSIAILLGALALVWGVTTIFTGLVLRRDVRLYTESEAAI
jgi:uncharacterized membrane protein HdeD (DUF308 family)